MAANRWSEARAAELLPVPYFHVVFTLPAEIAAIAFCNRRVVFGILFQTVAETPTHHRVDLFPPLVGHRGPPRMPCAKGKP